ncbi:angiotensin-converting enzyme-like [Diadema antillarum]|uniref:angiotensin-converting enzyme-like n=1 Tax=Diadema antillarum TaxID=105358 RepID=UPI003A8526C0
MAMLIHTTVFFVIVLVAAMCAMTAATTTPQATPPAGRVEAASIMDELAAQEQGSNANETQCVIFLEEYNRLAMEVYSFSASKAWIYNTNITRYNQEQLVEARLKSSNFSAEMRLRALVFNDTEFSERTKQLLYSLTFEGGSALKNEEEYKDYLELLSAMKGRYSSGKPCKKDGTCYPLDPDLHTIMARSRDYDELFWAWDAWRDEVGAPARADFVKYVQTKNKIARANGYADSGEAWRGSYEVESIPSLAEMVDDLYHQLEPLYLSLHAYVRRKLYNLYGPRYINLRGPIPAHILGNMWAQTWSYLSDICEPFPNKTRVDFKELTRIMVKQNYTVIKMYEMAEEFFISLGLDPLPASFWNDSMLVRPSDGRNVNCHPSAWDFSNQRDFRIKMCTTVNMGHFITIHHEMGHTQYQMMYKDLPLTFRGGANPAFHEALGDVLALSVSTPQHLHKVGLLENLEVDREADLNFLMGIALEKIAFLPSGILFDQWRWSVFNGSTPESRYNSDWWKLRLRYQGIIPPVKRTEDDFDPAAKYHIAANVPYIRYFISFITQFQFHGALCKAANHTGPLYTCDIHGSKEAGTLLSEMMQKGSSEPWPDVMEAMTGDRTLSAEYLVEYFRPLIDYLEEENRKNGDVLGWPEMYTPQEPKGLSGRGAIMQPGSAILLAFICAFIYNGVI